MVKIVILGSCRFSPYEILAKPDPLNPAYEIENHHAFNTEEEYQNAIKIFYPAIEESDIVIVYAPDGIGEHTGRDMNKALDEGKRVIVILKNRLIDGPTRWWNNTERSEFKEDS